MTKKKSTKRALISSLLILAMCFTMLAGTTFAWFTDSVTSANNIIKSGKLDVSMKWADGKDDPATAATTWTDASAGAIFNYDLWEPGYVDVKHIAISNDGTLALKYKVQIVANGEVSELADVIDVYYYDPAAQIAARTAIDENKKIGTLRAALSGMDTTASGNLLAGAKDVITIALKMRESAGNEYQEKSIGADFSIVLLATQYTYEPDSFDEKYDELAAYPGQTIVSGATELGNVINDLNTDASQWNEPAEITLVAGTYAQPITIEQYPDATDYGAVSGGTGVGNITAADSNDVTLKGDGTVVVTSPLTIKGANRSGSGYSYLQQGDGKTVIEGIIFEGTLQDGDVDTTLIDLDEAANNVVFKNCTFKNQTHILVGHGGQAKAGLVIFENCTFENAACFSGYYYDLRIINCTGSVDSGHGKGLINIQGGGKALIKGCSFDLGNIAYIVRTSGGGSNVTLEDNTFTGSPALIVKFRGSNESVTFKNSTLNGGQVAGTSEGVDADSILTIQ